jgi:hypothetical protein
MNGFRVSIYAHPPQIIIEGNSAQYLNLCLEKISRHSLYYIISPTLAYFWPAPLTIAFYEKLDCDLTKVEKQARGCSCYLGFLHVDLAYKYSDSRKCPDEEQAWEQAIRDKLNQKDFPVALHALILVDHKKVLQELIITNKAAKDAGFTEKTQ